ncbi:putative tyrosine-protein phosphatase [Phaeosphaeria sp. MPI-PUGE-AT-0046c]|nr:putative tyrosine-protein phosphatase [Phaeosphaeria sp. MPI-PUGE-AT-0046c]
MSDSHALAPGPQSSASSPPELPFPLFNGLRSLPNFRDIGGWPISSSTTLKHVRKSLIYRGPDTTHISPQDLSTLQSLNITTDYDLRSAGQIAKLGFRDFSEYGIKRVWCPVFSSEDEKTEEEGVKKRYEQYASDDVSDIVEAFISTLISGSHVLATILRDLLSSVPPSAVFVHCTTGNNRTGPFVALLLLLLYVPKAYIVHEYYLSELGLASSRNVNVQRLLRKGAFSEYGPVEARRKCERMVGARRESMEGLLDEVERRWGGAEGYFLAVVGLSEREVQRVRDSFTAEGEGDLVETRDVGFRTS